MNNDTIFALSSGFGKSGVAVIRISGDDLAGMFKTFLGKEFTPRHAYYCNLRDDSNELLDQCIIVYFKAPQSFTGQDVIEVYSHGAPAVINAIFKYLKTFGARMATRGEFSRRAFYNNKMDLTDVDGLAALLDATTDAQRKSALKSMLGGDGKIYTAWRTKMIEIAAYSAAILDYDSDDLPKNIGDKIISETTKLYDEISGALSRYKTNRTIRSGFNIALVGETNVGKSSIFNRLVGSNRAIVSNTPGTTRDVVSAQLDIDGYLVNLSDTAGLRDTNDEIEKIGIERTRDEIQNANLILRVETNDTKIKPNENEITVINKSDLLTSKTNKNAIYVSAKTNDGIDTLMSAIRSKIHKLLDGTESDLVLNARTYELLSECKDELHNALIKSDGNYDIFSEHVRRASDAIGKILGTITANDVMDATFSQLCLGK
ncbi:MAG: tRNA uridine-5-carboxymethylaminomethyl(34) synthesis GTPase MnmE [Alphaproteobacteria bacterium]